MRLGMFGYIGECLGRFECVEVFFCMFSYVSILVFVLANDEQGYHQG